MHKSSSGQSAGSRINSSWSKVEIELPERLVEAAVKVVVQSSSFVWSCLYCNAIMLQYWNRWLLIVKKPHCFPEGISRRFFQLETHRCTCYRKQGGKPRPKLCPKHPTKVHGCGGISKKGAIAVCIFEGIMTASLYCDILQLALVPFIQEKYPGSHRFMQDDDTKHTSRVASG